MHLNQVACYGCLMPALLTHNHFAIWAASARFGHNGGTDRRLCCISLDGEPVYNSAFQFFMCLGSPGDPVKRQIPSGAQESVFLASCQVIPRNLH